MMGVGLSMDAFSLSILYGTLNLSKRKQKMLALIVGMYHFLMPCLGNITGKLFLSNLFLQVEYLVGTIFLLLSIQMVCSLKKQEELTILTNIFSLLLFGFTVSIDSFSVGVALGALQYNLWLSCITFSLTSMAFTYTGLKIGTTFSDRYGKYATILGSIILFFLALSYFF